MNDLGYIMMLRDAFIKHDGCIAQHIETAFVNRRSRGKCVWKGEVEVFDLIGHSKAARGYAWAYDRINGSETVTMLELPPVISPKTAFEAAIFVKSKTLKRSRIETSSTNVNRLGRIRHKAM